MPPESGLLSPTAPEPRPRPLTPYHLAVGEMPTAEPRHIMNPQTGVRFCACLDLGWSDGSGWSSGTAPRRIQSNPPELADRSRHFPSMSEKRIKLDPVAVDAVARKVVELLEQRGVQKRPLVDAAELARMFGIERSWVYSHAIELGAVKLGDGPKPRLRFDPEIAVRVLRRVGEVPAADPPARSGERADRPRWTRRPEVRLLPVEGPDGERTPPAA